MWLIQLGEYNYGLLTVKICHEKGAQVVKVDVNSGHYLTKSA